MSHPNPSFDPENSRPDDIVNDNDTSFVCPKCGLESESWRCLFCVPETQDLANQETLFGADQIPTEWEEEWQGMPEFVQEDKQPYQKVIVSFYSKDDVDKFAEIIGQPVTENTSSIRFPKQESLPPKNFMYVEES